MGTSEKQFRKLLSLSGKSLVWRIERMEIKTTKDIGYAFDTAHQVENYEEFKNKKWISVVSLIQYIKDEAYNINEVELVELLEESEE